MIVEDGDEKIPDEPVTPKPFNGQPKRQWKYQVEQWRRGVLDYVS